MKKEATGLLFVLLAMLLVLISRIIYTQGRLDLLAYLAIAIAISAFFILFKIYRTLK